MRLKLNDYLTSLRRRFQPYRNSLVLENTFKNHQSYLTGKLHKIGVITTRLDPDFFLRLTSLREPRIHLKGS